MIVTTAAFILIITAQVVLAQNHRLATKGQITLDMAVNSVDDQYDGCSENMKNLVETKFLNKEISANVSGFGKAWRDGEKKYPGPQDNLTRNHLISISVYTGPKVYKGFNEDARSGKEKYKTLAYTWYSLQFWLTEAIQILSKTENKCKLTYRGTTVKFEAVRDTEIRFGSFSSSSLNRTVAATFGNESCFEINTCKGASIAKYSQKPEEEEVLIPPYETFMVTAIKENAWCKTVFILKSFAVRSDLNCAVTSIKTYHGKKSFSRGRKPLHRRSKHF